MKHLALIALLLLAAASICPAQERFYPVPAARQLKWHESELGVVFHYDLHVFDQDVLGGCGEDPGSESTP